MILVSFWSRRKLRNLGPRSLGVKSLGAQELEDKAKREKREVHVEGQGELQRIRHITWPGFDVPISAAGGEDESDGAKQNPPPPGEAEGTPRVEVEVSGERGEAEATQRCPYKPPKGLHLPGFQKGIRDIYEEMGYRCEDTVWTTYADHASPKPTTGRNQLTLKERADADDCDFDYYADHASPTPTTDEDTLPLNWPTSKEPRSKSPGPRT